MGERGAARVVTVPRLRDISPATCYRTCQHGQVCGSPIAHFYRPANNLTAASLEFNLHQLIVNDLAKSVAPVPNVALSPHAREAEEKSIDTVVNVLSSRVETRVKSSDRPGPQLQNGFDAEDLPGTPPTENETRVYMTASRVHCNIAFGELAHNLPPSYAANSVTVLVDILTDIPYIDFEPSLAWEGTFCTRISLVDVLIDLTSFRMGTSRPIGVFNRLCSAQDHIRPRRIPKHRHVSHRGLLSANSQATRIRKS